MGHYTRIVRTEPGPTAWVIGLLWGSFVWVRLMAMAVMLMMLISAGTGRLLLLLG